MNTQPTDTALLIRKAAMNYLARREFGQIELVKKLKARFSESNLVESVVSKLAYEGLQSDERFVAHFILSRQQKGQGPLRIVAELKLQHIADKTIAAQLTMHDPLWLDLAAKVYRKKYPNANPKDDNQRFQYMRFLHYRGFTHEQMAYAMKPTDESD